MASYTIKIKCQTQKYTCKLHTVKTTGNELTRWKWTTGIFVQLGILGYSEKALRWDSS